MTKYYRNAQGKFLGGFDGSNPPQGSIEVQTPPSNGSFTYVNGSWVAPADHYKSQRQAAYPSIGEQLDMQYHDLLDGTTTWKDAVAAVKAQYPKP